MTRKAHCLGVATACLAVAIAAVANQALARQPAPRAESSSNTQSARKATSAQPKARTDAGEQTLDAKSAEIMRRMKAMRLPKVSFEPPATLIDAVDFFRKASAEHDSPELPEKDRGFSFIMNLADPAAGLPALPKIAADDITFYDALKLVCGKIHYKFTVENGVVRLYPDDAAKAKGAKQK